MITVTSVWNDARPMVTTAYSSEGESGPQSFTVSVSRRLSAAESDSGPAAPVYRHKRDPSVGPSVRVERVNA